MRSLKLAMIAAAATAALSSGAYAADLMVDTPVVSTPIVDNTFNWDGAYMGAFIQGQTAPTAFGLGVDLGVNALMSNILIGGELEGVVATGPNFSAQATGRVGGLIGDSAILYVYSGVGTRTPTSWYVPVGVGVEFAVADNVGLKTEAQYNWDLTGGPDSAAVKVGLNFHF